SDGCIQQKREYIRGPEAGNLEESQRQHRRSTSTFDDYKSEQCNRATNKAAVNIWAAPALSRRFEQAIDDRTEAEGGGQSPCPILATSVRVTAIRNVQQANYTHRGRKRQIYEEDPVPGNILDQPSTEYRTNRGGDRREPRPRSYRLAARLLVERGADDRQAARHQKGRTDPLQRAPENKLANRSGQSASERRSRKHEHTAHKHFSPADEVSQAAAN